MTDDADYKITWEDLWWVKAVKRELAELDTDILYNYSRRLLPEYFEYALDYIPELGINPYYWMTQGENDKGDVPDLRQAEDVEGDRNGAA